MNEKLVSDMLDFISKSPSAFHAVSNVCRLLEEQSFVRLSEREIWQIHAGGRYYLCRNGSALIAFTVPAGWRPEYGFTLTASHSDSPVFKIKENPELAGAGAVTLNVEKYGGLLMQPWFDRPLSVAGRLVVRGKGSQAGGKKSPLLETKLVDIDRDLLLIPNLAIHMNREANDGHKIDAQAEMRPVLSLDQQATLRALLAEAAGVSSDDILGEDLYVYNRTPCSRWGARQEFISAPRLDDLECAWSSLQGFLAAAEKELSGRPLPLYCLFDNEEVGSSSRQGADSTFLSDILSRLSEKLEVRGEDYRIALANSIMVSADNAHALHPNYPSVADPVNRPLINGGIVIKYNASQKYTTDGESGAFFKLVCERAGVPWQIFTNNSNVAGGSTLGNISQNHVSISCLDVGLAQWAMHSPYETAGADDVAYMVKAITELYQMESRC